MSPYNAYSYSSSRFVPSRTYTGSSYSSKYPSYSSPSKYSSGISSSSSLLSRNPSLSYVSPRILTSVSPRIPTSPRVVTSVSAYAAALSAPLESKWSDRSPSLTLSRRSSLTRPPVESYTSSSKSLPRYLSKDDEEKSGQEIGFNNLGNTCFMNAVLQCLCHTQPLIDYCVRNSHFSDINYRSQTRGDLMKVFSDFMKKVSEAKSQSVISPYQLRREVQRYAPRFCGDNQQDAQEFLRYLLQGLHDDINRVKGRSGSLKSETIGNDTFSSWKNYKKTDDSLIVDLFAGQLKSTLKCTECNNESITYDPFWDISLPIPEGSRNTSLRQCFHLFSSPEVLDEANKPFCEVCRKKTRSTKKIEVNKFPKVLVIHLKRFSATCYGLKLNTMVECPMKLGSTADLAASSTAGDGCSYVLYGVVDHDGSNNSGHYTAKCRSLDAKEWNEFNDSRVSKASSIVTNKAYILFYIKDGDF